MNKMLGRMFRLGIQRSRELRTPQVREARGIVARVLDRTRTGPPAATESEKPSDA